MISLFKISELLENEGTGQVDHEGDEPSDELQPDDDDNEAGEEEDFIPHFPIEDVEFEDRDEEQVELRKYNTKIFKRIQHREKKKIYSVHTIRCAKKTYKEPYFFFNCKPFQCELPSILVCCHSLPALSILKLLATTFQLRVFLEET